MEKSILFITTKFGSGIVDRVKNLGFGFVEEKNLDAFGGVTVDVYSKDAFLICITESFYNNKEFQKLSYDECFSFIKDLASSFKEKNDIVFCEIHGSDIEPRYSHYISSGRLSKYCNDDVLIDLFHHDYASRFYIELMKYSEDSMHLMNFLHDYYNKDSELWEYLNFDNAVAGQVNGSERGFLPSVQVEQFKEEIEYNKDELLSFIEKDTCVNTKDLESLTVPCYVIVKQDNKNISDSYFYFNHSLGELVHVPFSELSKISDSPGFCFEIRVGRNGEYEPGILLTYLKSIIQSTTRNEENIVFCCCPRRPRRNANLSVYKDFLNLSPCLLDNNIVVAFNESMYNELLRNGRHVGTKGLIVDEGVKVIPPLDCHWLQWIDLPKSLSRIDGEWSFEGDVFRLLNIPENAEALPKTYSKVPLVYLENKDGFQVYDTAGAECLKNRLNVIEVVSKEKLYQVLYESLGSIRPRLNIPIQVFNQINIGSFKRTIHLDPDDRLWIELKPGENNNIVLCCERSKACSANIVEKFSIPEDFPLANVVAETLSYNQKSGTEYIKEEVATLMNLLYVKAGKTLRELDDYSKAQCQYIKIDQQLIAKLESEGYNELDLHCFSQKDTLPEILHPVYHSEDNLTNVLSSESRHEKTGLLRDEGRREVIETREERRARLLAESKRKEKIHFNIKSSKVNDKKITPKR